MSSRSILESLGGKKLNLGQLAQSSAQVSTQKHIELANSEIISPAINETTFLYDHLISHHYVEEEGDKYRARWKDGKDYISFYVSEIDKTTPQRRAYREHGLKIHISLDDTVEGNIASGWNAIAGLVKYYNVARVKVVQVDGGIAKDAKQAAYGQGKQITIYASLNADNGNWANILCAFTQALLEKGVKPGYRPDPRSSKAIEGNCYISYRNDFDPITKKGRKAKILDGAFPPGVEDTLESQCRLVGQAILTPGLVPKPYEESSTANSQDNNTKTTGLGQ